MARAPEIRQRVGHVTKKADAPARFYSLQKFEQKSAQTLKFKSAQTSKFEQKKFKQKKFEQKSAHSLKFERISAQTEIRSYCAQTVSATYLSRKLIKKRQDFSTVYYLLVAVLALAKQSDYDALRSTRNGELTTCDRYSWQHGKQGTCDATLLDRCAPETRRADTYHSTPFATDRARKASCSCVALRPCRVEAVVLFPTLPIVVRLDDCALLWGRFVDREQVPHYQK